MTFDLDPKWVKSPGGGHVEQTRIVRVHQPRLIREGVRHANSDPSSRRFRRIDRPIGVGLQSANADSGSITLTIYKGGWIIGGSAGGGTLTFRGLLQLATPSSACHYERGSIAPVAVSRKICLNLAPECRGGFAV